MKLDHCLTSYTKINSKWFKDLNLKPKTIKYLGSKLLDIVLSNIFWDLIPEAMATKEKINK